MTPFRESTYTHNTIIYIYSIERDLEKIYQFQMVTSGKVGKNWTKDTMEKAKKGLWYYL